MLKGILFAEMLFQFEVQRSGLLGLEDWRTGLHGSFFFMCVNHTDFQTRPARQESSKMAQPGRFSSNNGEHRFNSVTKMQFLLE